MTSATDRDGRAANLGFLFTEYPLVEAVRATARSGFGAVEFHYPYDAGAMPLREVLEETGLPVPSLNTRPGDVAAGEFGLAALPGRTAEARAEIDRSARLAARAGVRHVHVLAGRTGDSASTEAVSRDNLSHACEAATRYGLGVLIEPINPHDVPFYHLQTPEHAAETIAHLGAPNLRLMLDCYRLGRMERNVAADIEAFRKVTGHIQIAAVPDRGAPDHGDVDYLALRPALSATGLPISAEYRPGGRTKDSLGWMSPFAAYEA